MKSALNFSLDGTVALVTGAAGSIGHGICCALSNAGARVVGTDLGAAPQEWGGESWWSQDVTSVADWVRVVEGIDQRFGRLDCLINNAGISLVERIADTSIERWRKVMSVNVESVLLGLQAFLPLLRESGKDRVGGSSVVNMASGAGLRGVALNAAYSSSKGALTLFTKSAAKEFAGLKYPIRVNSVHPAGVDTPMLNSIFERYVEAGLSPSVEAAKQAADAATPMGRLATPADIAGGVVFLCSTAASFMTGAELVIDGGALS